MGSKAGVEASRSIWSMTDWVDMPKMTESRIKPTSKVYTIALSNVPSIIYENGRNVKGIIGETR